MCSIIPEAWNIHTIIVMLQHELFVHSVAALPCLAHHCALFTFVYILPSELPNVILFIKQYFQIKGTNNLQRVPMVYQNHGTFRPVNVLQYCGIHVDDVVMQLTWNNTQECSGNMVAILDYFHLDLYFW